MKKNAPGLLLALLLAVSGPAVAASTVAVDAPMPLDRPLYAQIAADTCVMRAQASRTGIAIQRIESPGAPVLLEGAGMDARGGMWYFLTFEGWEGYLPEENLLLLEEAEYIALRKAAPPSPPPETTQAPAPARHTAAYIGNTDSMVFHRADCGNLPMPVRQILFSFRETALSRGFVPCLLCNP